MATLVHIVVTPGSGGGRATAVAPDVRARLEQEGYATRLQAFRTLGELVQWTRTCRAAFSYLVAIGGDATVSAVAEAAVRLSVPLVPVPLGFGNLFTSAFEHPGEPDAVAALLGRGERRDVPLARELRLPGAHPGGRRATPPATAALPAAALVLSDGGQAALRRRARFHPGRDRRPRRPGQGGARHHRERRDLSGLSQPDSGGVAAGRRLRRVRDPAHDPGAHPDPADQGDARPAGRPRRNWTLSRPSRPRAGEPAKARGRADPPRRAAAPGARGQPR